MSIVNVLFHGVFGYVLRKDNIEVYTPAVVGHIYEAGGVDDSVAQPLKRFARYTLRGVCGDSGERCEPDPAHHPVLPFHGSDEIDEFDKRFCSFVIPYPKKTGNYPKQLFPVDPYDTGSIFAGKHADPLNQMSECPCALIFVYEEDGTPLTFYDEIHGKSVDLSRLPYRPIPGIRNAHIWCTTKPHDQMEKKDATAHLRRAFAALVDLFPTLQLTIQMPDGFDPASTPEYLPTGVGPCDVDPGRSGCTHFGKTNCHYSTLMFWPG